VLELGGANNLTVLEYQQRKELALADIQNKKNGSYPIPNRALKATNNLFQITS